MTNLAQLRDSTDQRFIIDVTKDCPIGNLKNIIQERQFQGNLKTLILDGDINPALAQEIVDGLADGITVEVLFPENLRSSSFQRSLDINISLAARIARINRFDAKAEFMAEPKHDGKREVFENVPEHDSPSVDAKAEVKQTAAPLTRTPEHHHVPELDAKKEVKFAAVVERINPLTLNPLSDPSNAPQLKVKRTRPLPNLNQADMPIEISLEQDAQHVENERQDKQKQSTLEINICPDEPIPEGITEYNIRHKFMTQTLGLASDDPLNLLSEQQLSAILDNIFGNNPSNETNYRQLRYGRYTLEACIQLLRYHHQFKLGFNLPPGFIIKRGTNGAILHYSAKYAKVDNKPIEIQYYKSVEPNVLSETSFAVWLTMAESDTNSDSPDYKLLEQWKLISTADTYNREAALIFKKYLPRLRTLTGAQLDSLFELSESSWPKIEFLLQNYAQIARTEPTNPLLLTKFADQVAAVKNLAAQLNGQMPVQDLKNHLLVQLLQNSKQQQLGSELISFNTKLNLSTANFNAILQVYETYGEVGLGRLFELWRKLKPATLTQMFNGIFAKMQSLVPLLDKNYIAALDYVEKLPPVQKEWWDKLFNQHCAAVGEDDLVALVNCFKAFAEKIAKYNLDFYSLKLLGNDSLQNATSLPGALNNIITILNTVDEKERQLQWKVITQIPLQSNTAIFALLNNWDISRRVTFLHPKMQLEEHFSVNNLYADTYDTLKQCDDSDISSLSRVAVRSVMKYPATQRMPAEFYFGSGKDYQLSTQLAVSSKKTDVKKASSLNDTTAKGAFDLIAIECPQFTAAQKKALCEILIRSTTDRYIEPFVNDDDGLKRWQNICRALNGIEVSLTAQIMLNAAAAAAAAKATLSGSTIKVPTNAEEVRDHILEVLLDLGSILETTLSNSIVPPLPLLEVMIDRLCQHIKALDKDLVKNDFDYLAKLAHTTLICDQLCMSAIYSSINLHLADPDLRAKFDLYKHLDSIVDIWTKIAELIPVLQQTVCLPKILGLFGKFTLNPEDVAELIAIYTELASKYHLGEEIFARIKDLNNIQKNYKIDEHGNKIILTTKDMISFFKAIKTQRDQDNKHASKSEAKAEVHVQTEQLSTDEHQAQAASETIAEKAEAKSEHKEPAEQSSNEHQAQAASETTAPKPETKTEVKSSTAHQAIANNINQTYVTLKDINVLLKGILQTNTINDFSYLLEQNKLLTSHKPLAEQNNSKQQPETKESTAVATALSDQPTAFESSSIIKPETKHDITSQDTGLSNEQDKPETKSSANTTIVPLANNITTKDIMKSMFGEYFPQNYFNPPTKTTIAQGIKDQGQQLLNKLDDGNVKTAISEFLQIFEDHDDITSHYIPTLTSIIKICLMLNPAQQQLDFINKLKNNLDLVDKLTVYQNDIAKLVKQKHSKVVHRTESLPLATKLLLKASDDEINSVIKRKEDSILLNIIDKVSNFSKESSDDDYEASLQQLHSKLDYYRELCPEEFEKSSLKELKQIISRPAYNEILQVVAPTSKPELKSKNETAKPQESRMDKFMRFFSDSPTKNTDKHDLKSKRNLSTTSLISSSDTLVTTKPITIIKKIRAITFDDVSETANRLKQDLRDRSQYSRLIKDILEKIYSITEAFPKAKDDLLNMLHQHLEDTDPRHNRYLTLFLWQDLHLLHKTFLDLKDPELVNTLCFYFSSEPERGELPRDFSALMEYIKIISDLPTDKRNLLLKIICFSFSNKLTIFNSTLRTIASSCKKDETFYNNLAACYRKPPYPTLDWFLATAKDNHEAVGKAYAEFAKQPCKRQDFNIFEVDKALLKAQEFGIDDLFVEDVTVPKANEQAQAPNEQAQAPNEQAQAPNEQAQAPSDPKKQYIQQLHQEITQTRTLTTEQLLLEINQIKTQPTPIKVNYRKLVAMLAELLYRSKGNDKDSFELNYTQYLAIIGMLETGERVASQIATGEGKSRVMMILMASQHILGKTVDFVTSDMNLAMRDYLESQAFFGTLGINSVLLSANSPVAHYQENTIHFTDAAHLSRFRNKVYRTGVKNTVINHEPQRRALLIDEFDKLIYNSYRTKYTYLSAIDPNIQGMDWVYSALIKFFDDQAHQDLYSDIELCTQQFIEFVRQYNSEQAEQLSKLAPEYIENWQTAAMAALSCEYERDFVISSNVSVETEHGLQINSVISLVQNNNIDESAKYPAGVQQCLLARLNFLKNNPQKVNNPQLREKLATCTQDFYISPEKRIEYSSSPINLINEYDAGTVYAVSGTAGSDLERQEAFHKFNLDFINVPPHSKNKRVDHPVQLTEDEDEQAKEILKLIKQMQMNLQPILIFCENDAASKQLIKRLKEHNTQLPPVLLDDNLQLITSTTNKNKMSKMINSAGSLNKITVATGGKAGRGTDIKTPFNNSGLCIIRTYLASSSSDESQEFGRAGRMGANGLTHTVLNKKEVRKKLMAEPSIEAIQQFQISSEREQQCQRLIIETVDQYRAKLLDIYYKSFSQCGVNDQKKLIPLYISFISKIDSEWETIYNDIKNSINMLNPKSEVIEIFLNQYNTIVREHWLDFCGKIEKEKITNPSSKSGIVHDLKNQFNKCNLGLEVAARKILDENKVIIPNCKPKEDSQGIFARIIEFFANLLKKLFASQATPAVESKKVSGPLIAPKVMFFNEPNITDEYFRESLGNPIILQKYTR